MIQVEWSGVEWVCTEYWVGVLWMKDKGNHATLRQVDFVLGDACNLYMLHIYYTAMLIAQCSSFVFRFAARLISTYFLLLLKHSVHRLANRGIWAHPGCQRFESSLPTLKAHVWVWYVAIRWLSSVVSGLRCGVIVIGDRPLPPEPWLAGDWPNYRMETSYFRRLK